MQTLDLNLASRPFKNNTLLWIVFSLALVMLIGVSIGNVQRYQRNRASLADLMMQVSDVETRLADFERRDRQALRDIAKHDLGLLTVRADKANEVIRCHNCGRNVPSFEAISPETICPSCSVEVHCCRTCQHFDSAARWQCRTEISEAVADKSSGNKCPQYSARLVLDTTGRRSGNAVGGGGPKEQFENLFKR